MTWIHLFGPFCFLGQAVPSGLHVRLNLETGEKEAKLMEGDDGMKYWREGDRQGKCHVHS